MALPPGSSCSHDSAAVCQALRTTYDDPKFRNLDSTPGESWFTRVARALGEAIAWVLKHIGPTNVALLIGLAALALIAFLVWRFRGLAARRRSVSGDDGSGTGLTEDAATEWRAAEVAAERGDHREAVRRAYRSALLDLAHHGRLHLEMSWTSRELVRAARADADVRAHLEPAAALFDEAWYSGHDVDETHWLAMRGRCAALRRLARRDAAEAA